MNVALLVGRFGPGTGTGGVAFGLARHLRDRGHHVRVWCRHRDVELAGVACAPLGARSSAAARVPAGFVRLGLDRVPGCEVVRTGGGVHAAARSFAAHRARWPDRESGLDAAAAKQARIVVCNANRVAGEVVAWHGIAPERVRVVRTGVDLERFRPDAARRREIRARLGVATEDRVVVFLGHGFRRKGLAVAAAAFAAVAGARDRFLLLGTDAHADRRLVAIRSALGDRLVAPGAVPEPERWLVGADAALLPTLYDAASNATLEAMACGLPTVVSAADGTAEIVSDRRLVVGDPRDVEGFARSLRYALRAPSPGDRCRGDVSAWPVSRMVEGLERILSECSDG